MVSSLFPSLKGPPEERDLLDHRRHERAFLCSGEAEEAVSSGGNGGATSHRRGLKLIWLCFGFFFFPLLQVPAGKPDPLRDQEVFLGPGRAAAPVSPAPLIVPES